jgi:hypothetical protein
MKFFFSSAIFFLIAQNNVGLFGRGGGIRTPTRGFGDRWSAVKPTLYFLMGLMLAAMTAELTQFDTFRLSLFVLGRRIVPVLALAALKRNDFAH